MSSDIKQKRMSSELSMLDKLPEGYNVEYQEFDGGVKVFLAISKNLINSQLLPGNVEVYEFTIV